MKKISADPFNPLPVVPVVLVGAKVGGKPNYTTAGFINGVNVRPPVLCIGLNNNHHTTKGIMENGTFSINVPSSRYVRETDFCGLVSGKTADKSGIFTTFYGELETAPMIEEFPITCECRCIGKKVEFAMDTAFFGEIHRVYLNEDIAFENGRFDIAAADPLILGSDNLYRIPGVSRGEAYRIGLEYEPSKDAAGTDPVANPCGCRFVELTAQPVLSIRWREGAADIRRTIGEALSAVAGFAGKSGDGPAGAPFVAYRGADGPGMELEAGFPFARRMEGNGAIRSGEIPGGSAACCIHTGPYDGLRDARTALYGWIRAQGRRSAGVFYEFYLNDPRTTPPDRLRTRIVVPLEKEMGA